MAFKCDPTTRAELDAAPNKQAWGTALNAALGNSRRIRCKKDSNAAAADPWATGTEFRNVGCTGALKIVGGKVVGLGRIKGTTIGLAADVSTGSSVLRVEGNGRWFEVTLGSAGSNADVVADGYFTPTNGLAIKPNFAISGKIFLPSGTGPAAPELDADAPVAFRVIDYTDKANPVIAGTAQMNVRDLDMVMDDAQIASEMGDVRIQRCADGAGVVIGTGGDCFRIAGTMFAMHGGANETVPGKPVYQFLSHAAPHGRWPSFPFRKDFNAAVDTLALPMHKIELLRANGTVIDVIELYSTRDANNTPGSGMAVNDPARNAPPNSNGVTAQYKPWFTCNMMHKWQSHKIKKNSKWSHYIPGVEADAIHPTNVAYFDSDPQQWPLYTGQNLTNGLGSWKIAPKWSRIAGSLNYTTGVGTDGNGLDTDIVDPYFTQPYRGRNITQFIGWGYEPGSTGHHTWYMAPGGSRHDRAPFPDVLARWASDPTGNRPHGNVPLEELKDAWIDTQFNEGCHYHPAATLERGYSLDKNKVKQGLVAYQGTYYGGGNEDFVPDVTNNGILLLVSNREGAASVDKYGRHFTNDYARDNMHSYSTGAFGVYLNNSPASVIATRHSFNAHILCTWEMSQGRFNGDSWLTREHAWHEWGHVNAWIASSSDPRCLSRGDIEEVWQRHLEAMYDSVYPRYLTGTDVWAKGLRACGFPTYLAVDTGANRYGYSNMGADSKLGYMGQVLMLMKQSGAWDAMRARSVKCRNILDLLVVSLGRATVDALYLTDGAVDASKNDNPPLTPITGPYADPQWGVTIAPKQGQENWIRDSDGNINGSSYIERFTNTSHLRAQCVWILRDYFPEFTFTNMAGAVGKLAGWYAEVEAGRLAGTNTQWHYRFANFGKFKKAAAIGAPV